MCGRYSLTPDDLERIAAILGGGVLPEEAARHRPRWNIAPSQETWILERAEGARMLRRAQWGFSAGPHGPRINARAESVATSPAWREAFRRRRCAVPADGFYEWKGAKGKKQPYRIGKRDGGLFVFAGLYDDRGERAFAIVTTEAAGPIAEIHPRAPAILAPERLDLWLSPKADEADLAALLRPRDSQWIATPVSARVNAVANDDPACAAPAAPAQGTLFG